MNKEIRLILSDLDGTLLPSDKIMTEYTKRTIRKLKEKGYLFGIASGRPIPPLKEKMRLWDMDSYVDVWIGNNGAVYEDSDGYSLKENFMSIEDMLEIYQQVKDLPVSCGVFDDEIKTIRVNRFNPMIELVARNNYYSCSIEDMGMVIREKQFPKLFVNGDKKTIDEAEKTLLAITSKSYYGVRSGAIMYEFLNCLVSKKTGIQKVCQHRNLLLKNIMVLGDGDNDVEMLDCAGVAVVMENGSEKAKAIADYIAGCNDEEGWGRFIENYFRL